MRVSSEKRILVLAAILVAIAVSGWIFRSSNAPPALFLPEELTHDPDYYLKDFVSTSMGKDGRPERRLSGESMVHYPDDDSATLERPRLVLFTERGRAWDIVSESGKVNAGGESIDLHGEVRIKGGLDATGNEVEIATSEVVVWPDRQQAETEHPVLITYSSGVVEAVGMRADFKVRRLELLDQVRGHYEQAAN